MIHTFYSMWLLYLKLLVFIRYWQLYIIFLSEFILFIVHIKVFSCSETMFIQWRWLKIILIVYFNHWKIFLRFPSTSRVLKNLFFWENLIYSCEVCLNHKMLFYTILTLSQWVTHQYVVEHGKHLAIHVVPRKHVFIFFSNSECFRITKKSWRIVSLSLILKCRSWSNYFWECIIKFPHL